MTLTAVPKPDAIEILPGIALANGAPLPRLTHIINTLNEGADVRATLISFRAAYSGPYHAIIVADGTTDGSCDNLVPLLSDGDTCPRCAKDQLADVARAEDDGVQLGCAGCGWVWVWQASDKIDVIRPEPDAEFIKRLDATKDGRSLAKYLKSDPRLGCGKSKELARVLADPDSVILHSDGHCRMIDGDLDMAVRIAAQNECIVAPGVAPLHCPPNEIPRRGKQWGSWSVWAAGKFAACDGCTKRKGGYEACVKAGTPCREVELQLQTKIKYSHSTWGGQILVDALGATVDGCGRPSKEFARREATFWAVFLMSAHTLDTRMGGWNQLPGRWGSQEIGLALRAWFADVPIVTARGIVAGHRYRADQRKDKKPYAPYNVRTSERRANHRYTHQVVFRPATCMKVWKPNWKELAPSGGGDTLLAASNIAEQGKEFRSKCKRKTDAEFMAQFCPDGWPSKIVPVDDITAVVLCYRRPANQQKAIDAIKSQGIKVWAWCNDGATIPTGCERVFTDSMNASTWGRYVVAPLISTKWILFCDDDVELTSCGIRALRAGGALGIDNGGLIGARFKPPKYDDYHKRAYYKSHNVREATPVDMLWPKGQLIYRDLAIQLFGEGNALWQEMRAAVGSTSGDDLISTVVQERIADGRVPRGRFAHVVPSAGKGYREHHSEGKTASLTKQPGRMKKKRGSMKLWRATGWRSVEEHIASGDFWGNSDDSEEAGNE